MAKRECKISKVVEDCWGLNECAGCFKEFNDEQARYVLRFGRAKIAPEIDLCEDCFEALKRAIIKDSNSASYVTTQKQVDKTCGLKENRIDVPYITAQEMQTGEWVPRKVVCEMFDICRSSLDRLRRVGKIDARRVCSTEVYDKGRLSYPHEGYLYNVKNLEEYFKNNQKYYTSKKKKKKED